VAQVVDFANRRLCPPVTCNSFSRNQAAGANHHIVTIELMRSMLAGQTVEAMWVSAACEAAGFRVLATVKGTFTIWEKTS
jgi:hypothetical protein